MDRPIGLMNRTFWKGNTTLHAGLQARTAMGLLLGVILLTLIGWLYLDQAATITATNADIRALHSESASIMKESRYLQSEIARMSSVERIMSRASVMGLQQPAQIARLKVEHVAAPTAEAPAADGQSATAQPWLYDLVSRLDSWARAQQGAGRVDAVAAAGPPAPAR